MANFKMVFFFMGNANGCLRVMVNNPFKESFYGKSKKNN